MRTETVAVVGFLAGYCGGTRRSYGTDLRLFSIWCHERNLTLFSVRRAHLELYGRWMEGTGRMRSTVARRLSTLASFYKYCEQEQLVDHNPALNVRRPKVTTNRAPWVWTATSSGPSSSRLASVRPVTTPWRPCWP
jgi:site-specific recombinase XerD